MHKGFFERNRRIREAIRLSLSQHIQNSVSDSRLTDVLLQRIRSASFLKGVLSYHLHQGLGGTLTQEQRIQFAAALELYFSHTAYLDNAIDQHDERNGATTYLKEHGVNVHLLAAGWALHSGIKLLLPKIKRWNEDLSSRYEYDTVFLAVGYENEALGSVDAVIDSLQGIYGCFTSTALVMAACSATDDPVKIAAVAECGSNLGVGIAIAEEIKDSFGKHGRRRGFEIEHGRMGLMLQLLQRSVPGCAVRDLLGRPLTDEDYRHLLDLCYSSGAVDQTIGEMTRFLGEGSNALREIVTETCHREIRSLTESITGAVRAIVTPREVG